MGSIKTNDTRNQQSVKNGTSVKLTTLLKPFNTLRTEAQGLLVDDTDESGLDVQGSALDHVLRGMTEDGLEDLGAEQGEGENPEGGGEQGSTTGNLLDGVVEHFGTLGSLGTFGSTGGNDQLLDEDGTERAHEDGYEPEESRGQEELAGVVGHGTPQAREIFAWLVAERVVLGPELRKPSVDMSGRIVGVEVVEVVLGEGLLGTLPHQAGHPGGEDVADGVGIDSVNIGLVLDLVGLLRDISPKVDVIEIHAGELEVILGVGRGGGLGCEGGESGEASLRGRNSRITSNVGSDDLGTDIILEKVGDVLAVLIPLLEPEVELGCGNGVETSKLQRKVGGDRRGGREGQEGGDMGSGLEGNLGPEGEMEEGWMGGG